MLRTPFWRTSAAHFLIISLAGLCVILILSTLGYIPAHLVPVIQVIPTVLGLVISVGPYIVKFRQNTKILGEDGAKRALLDAIKRSRAIDGHAFKLERLPARIERRLIGVDDSPESDGKLLAEMHKASPNLLLLGKSGSGKTILLQQFALDLMDRALDERRHREEDIQLPVFLYLGDWASEKRKRPLKVWISKQLARKLSRHIYSDGLLDYCIENGKLVLLLDGLDEMSLEDSGKCIDAINTFASETHCYFIISCQLDRYGALESVSNRLDIGEDIGIVKALDPQQAQKYLHEVRAGEFSRIFQPDQDEKYQRLRHIVDTPLMLSMLASMPADSMKQFDELPDDLSEGDLEDALFRRYVNRATDPTQMPRYLYKKDDMSHRLTLLANHMGNSPLFYFQPDSLPDRMSKSLYLGSTWLVVTLPGGIASLFVILGSFSLWQLLIGIGLIVIGFYSYLYQSMLTGVYMVVLHLLTLFYPSFSLSASKKKTQLGRSVEVLMTQIGIFLLATLVNILVFICTLAIGVPAWLGIAAVAVAQGLFWYSVYKRWGLQLSSNDSSVLNTWLTLVNLMIARLVEPHSPNRLSPKNSASILLKGVLIGIVSGGTIWLIGFITGHTNLLLVSVLIGVAVWLDRGLGAGIRGYILRFWLWRYKVLPWQAGFLEAAVVRKLLVRKSGGYRFYYEAPLQNYFLRKAQSSQRELEK